MTQLARRLFLALAPLLAVPTVGFAASPISEVFTVSAVGGGDFTSLQAAISQVPDGSTLRVAQWPDSSIGSYGSVEITGKSLTIEGVGPEPVMASWVRVSDLGAQQVVRLRNLHFRSLTEPANEVRLTANNLEGTLRLHGCKFTMAERRFGIKSAIVQLIDCADVTLDRCEIDAGLAFRDGLLVERSRATLTRSSVSAGHSQRAFALNRPRDGQTGRTGMIVRGRSFAWLGHCEVHGGDGEDIENAYFGMGTANGGDGGTGLDVGQSSNCFAVDSQFSPGERGYYYLWNGVGEQNPGMDGSAVVGPLAIVPGQPRLLSAVTRTPVSDQPIRLTVQGLPGEFVRILGSRDVHFRFLGPLFGVFGLRAPDPALFFDAGQIPASGTLEFEMDPDLAPGGGTDIIDLQAICRTSPTRFRISNVESIVRISPEDSDPSQLDRLYVDASASPGGNGASWNSAISDLGFALQVAGSTANRTVELWVAEGRYVPPSLPSVPEAFILKDGIQLYGGFPANGGTLTDRDPSLFPTVLDADLLGDDGPGFAQRADNTGWLLRSPLAVHSGLEPVTGVHIDGLQFRGLGAPTAFFDWSEAGAIRAAGEVTVRGCRFYDSEGLAIGIDGTAHVRNCAFVECRHTGVRVTGPGGATLVGCLFQDCRRDVGYPRTLIDMVAGPLELVNCTIRRSGASVSTCSGSPTPIVRSLGQQLYMRNCVFWEVACGTNPDWVLQTSAAVDIRYCGFEAPNLFNQDTTNQALDPRFASFGDPSLRSDSPYIDAGDNSAIAPDYITDLFGGWRIVDDPAVTGTGASARIVDFGAVERQ